MSALVKDVASAAELIRIRRLRQGFVINSKGPDDPWWTPTAILHSAGCGSLSQAGPDFKHFSESYYDAVAWLEQKRPKNWTACGLCSPRPGRGEVKTDRAKRSVSFLVNDKSRYGATTVLHTADCRAAAAATQKLQEFEDFDSAVLWLRSKVGAENTNWSRCGICRPTAPRMPRPRTEPARAAAPQALPVETMAADSAITPVKPATLDREISSLKTQLGAATQRAERAETALATALRDVESASDRLAGIEARQTDTSEAFEATAKERDALREALAGAEASAAAAEVRARDAIAEAVGLRKRVGAGDDLAFAEEALVSVADRLVEAGQLRGDFGRLLIADMLIAAPGNPRLQEYQGVILSSIGSDAEALAILDGVAGHLTKHGRIASVVSSFRLGRPVARDEWIIEVDWQDAQLAPALRSGLARMAPDRAIATIGRLRADLKPKPLRDLLVDQYERELSDEELVALLEAWESIDPQEASARLCLIARQRPIEDANWLDRALDRAVRRDPEWTDALQIIAQRLAGLGPEAAIERASKVAASLDGAASLQFRQLAVEVIAGAPSSDSIRDGLMALVQDLPARWRAIGANEKAERAERLIRGLRADPGGGSAPGANLQIVPVESAAAILAAIEAKYPALIVLPQAHASAGRWARHNLTKLTDTLEALGAAAQRYAADKNLDGYAELRTVPCRFAPNVSKTALQRFPGDYLINDPDGNTVKLGPHFLVGSGDNVCRIYLAVDQARRRYIVGHVGDHLRDASNVT